MKITLVQMNAIISDFDKNTETILHHAQRAKSEGADLVVYPALCICGYPPGDLAFHPAFREANTKALVVLRAELPKELTVVLSGLSSGAQKIKNSARYFIACISHGEIIHQQEHTFLSPRNIYTETHVAESERNYHSFDMGGKRIVTAIYDNGWEDTQYADAHYEQIAREEPDLLILSAASFFHVAGRENREHHIARAAQKHGISTIFVNTVGAHDSFIFDGYSCAFDTTGRLAARLPGFEETYSILSFPFEAPQYIHPAAETHADLAQALSQGIREFVHKNGFSQVHLGLSGGIDSALVATLAHKALGSQHVHAVLMPSPYSSRGSVEDAMELCRNLEIQHTKIPIHDMFRSFLDALHMLPEPEEKETTPENLQARVRSTLLMAIANRDTSMLLNTGNKSELSVGYCTLYGDMSGALSVIGDLFKTEVYALAKYFNEQSPCIPPAILKKAPSAELRPQQKDRDTLPPYDVLDAILHLHIMQRLGQREIVKEGFERKLVQRILTMVQYAEFKRFQAPPALIVSPLAFSPGRNIPITARRVAQL